MELSLLSHLHAALCMRPMVPLRPTPVVCGILVAYDVPTKENQMHIKQALTLMARWQTETKLPAISDGSKQAALQNRIDVNAVPRGLPVPFSVQMIVEMQENRVHTAVSREFAAAVQQGSSHNMRQNLTGGEMQAIMSTIMFPEWFVGHDEAARRFLCSFNMFERLRLETDMIVPIATALCQAADRYFAALAKSKSDLQRVAARRQTA